MTDRIQQRRENAIRLMHERAPSPRGDGQRTNSVSAPVDAAPHLHGRSELPVRVLAPAPKAISITPLIPFIGSHHVEGVEACACADDRAKSGRADKAHGKTEPFHSESPSRKSERPVPGPAVDPSGLSHHRGTAR